MPNFEIKPREVIASVVIACIMIIIGFFIGHKVSLWQMDKNEVYNKAVRVEDPSTFKYMLETDIGDSFVYGDLDAVDTVSMDDVRDYMIINRVLQKYTMHTRLVAHRSGKTTYYTTETYWTWDYAGEDTVKSKYVTFLGVKFPKSKFEICTYELKTVSCGYHRRYIYNVANKHYTGTAFMNIKDHDINSVDFQNKVTLDEAVSKFSCKYYTLVFWICYSILIVGVIFLFYWIDNEWLED